MSADNKKKFEGFTEDERAAMRARAKELAAEAKSNKSRAAGEKAIQDVIKEMPEPDRSMAKKFHEIVKKNAPALFPKTWYGMPAYAKNDKVICFYQGAYKFDYRYATLGFNDPSNLDEGNLWPVVFAIKKMTPAEEKKIAELVKKAVS